MTNSASQTDETQCRQDKGGIRMQECQDRTVNTKEDTRLDCLRSKQVSNQAGGHPRHDSTLRVTPRLDTQHPSPRRRGAPANCWELVPTWQFLAWSKNEVIPKSAYWLQPGTGKPHQPFKSCPTLRGGGVLRPFFLPRWSASFIYPAALLSVKVLASEQRVSLFTRRI